MEYCARHIKKAHSWLYRIMYYDCAPSDKVLFHPLTRRQVDLRKSDHYGWMTAFHNELRKKRKVALRIGEELKIQDGYTLRPDSLKRLCAGTIKLPDLRESDFSLQIVQKGVDMRVGLDIASLAEKALVNQIIMLSGDSDFVPAAKLARRFGIDFILDPLWAHIADSLSEHVDGIIGCVTPPPRNLEHPLHANYVESAKSSDTGEAVAFGG